MAIWQTRSQRRINELETKIFTLEEKLKRGGVNVPGELLNALFDGENKVTINEDTALTLSAFYSGLNILCDSLNIPVGVYKRMRDGNRVPVTSKQPYEYSVYNLLHISPNRMHTPSQWFTLMESSRIIYGNGYSLIVRNKIGEPIALQWLHPSRVEVKTDGVELTYNIKQENGVSYYLQNVSAMDMVHVKNMSFDGYVGKGVIEIAAESMGFGLQTQKAGNKFFADNMTSKVVYSHPGSLGGAGGKAKENLQTSLEQELKTKRTVVLEEGIKVYTLSIPPEQAQFLESRRFSVTEVARWLNIPEYMLANQDPTFSNIEGFGNYFLMMNARPRYRLYEQEFNWKLLANHPDVYTEFNMNALLRANVVDRATFYVQMVQNGIMSRNEIRGLENMNKVDGGDEFLTPLNLATDSEREKNASTDISQPDQEAGL